jgi:hypothetical protein
MSSQPNPLPSKEPEDKFPPSPSLLSAVTRHWKENLPKAYKELPPGTLEKLVQWADAQIADMISKEGLSVSAANEVVYPSLFPEPEGSNPSDEPEEVLS